MNEGINERRGMTGECKRRSKPYHVTYSANPNNIYFFKTFILTASLL